MFRTLQAGRGIAAISVLLYHLNKQMDVDFGYSIPPFTIGFSGVDFFFVLSGFIIYYSHRLEVGTGQVGQYFRKRFIRLFPVYWIVLAGALAVIFLIPSFGEPPQRQLLVILSSVTLVPLEPTTVIGQAWTLYHEVLFYAVFGLWLIDRRFGWLGFVWLAACATRLTSTAPVWNEIGDLLRFLTSPLNLLFGLGVLTAWAQTHLPPSRPRIAAAAGAAILVIVAPFMPAQAAWMHMTFGIGCALIVYGLCALENKDRMHPPSWLGGLGDASYSIYLTHTFLISAGAMLLQQIQLPIAAGFLFLGSFALAGGVMFHRWVEKPVLGLLRRTLSARERPVSVGSG